MAMSKSYDDSEEDDTSAWTVVDFSGDSEETANATKVKSQGHLNSSLLTAVIRDDFKAVVRALDDGASVNATCSVTRASALLTAVACGHQDISRLLISRQADVGGRNLKGCQAVHLAAATGNVNLLQALMSRDQHAAFSQVDRSLCTLQELGDLDMCDARGNGHHRLSKVPDIPQGATPLHAVCQSINVDCALAILDHAGTREQMKICDEDGLTPLDVVGEFDSSLCGNCPSTPCSSNHSMMNACSKAVQVPEDLYMGFDQGLGNEDSHNAGSTNYESKAFKIVKALISMGAEMPSPETKLRRTCLHWAVDHQDFELLKLLLQHGSSLGIQNNMGDTPLHLAASRKSLTSLRLMLQYQSAKWAVNIKNNSHRTVLHEAVVGGWISGVKQLLEFGADVMRVSDKGDTVLHLAARLGNTAVLDTLIRAPGALEMIDWQNESLETPLWCAVQTGNHHCISLLMGHEALVTEAQPGRWNLLHLASHRGHRLALEVLLNNQSLKALKNISSTNDINVGTPLFIAALHGHVDCVRVLLAAGCDLLRPTTRPWHSLPVGSTPLHAAASSGHNTVVDIITTNKNSTMTVTNIEGLCPLLVAIQSRRKDCVRTMLLKGANLSVTIPAVGNEREKTAMEMIMNTFPHPESFLLEVFDSYIDVGRYSTADPLSEGSISYRSLLPIDDNKSQFQAIQSLLYCRPHVKKSKLLLHPVIKSFVYLKWKKVQNLFCISIALQLMFTIAFTWIVLTTEDKNKDCLTDPVASNRTCRILICFWLFFINVVDWLNKDDGPSDYWLNLFRMWMTFKCLTTLMAVATLVLQFHYKDHYRSVAALAIIVVWFQLISSLSCWLTPGIYILMFYAVLYNVLKVLATFIFIILGFAFAFSVIFPAHIAFRSWWKSILKVLVMMYDLGYNDQFFDEQNVVVLFLFPLFGLLVLVVLMNLLIGLAVSDVKALETHGHACCLLQQVKMLRGVELFFRRVMTGLWDVTGDDYVRRSVNISSICYIYFDGDRQAKNIISADILETIFICITDDKSNKKESSQ